MLLWGGLFGAAYGLLAYAIIAGPKPNLAASYSFLALVPVALGAVPLLFSDPDQVAWFRKAFFIPWVSTLGLFLVLLAARAEGPICFLVLLGPFVLFISAGIWVVRAVGLRRLKKAQRKAAGIALLLLPFVAVGLEHRWLARAETNLVATTVTVHAAPATVWAQIVEVAPLDDRELPPGLLNRLGLPRPLQATVDALRTGGVRTGRFEDGLRFVETIRDYQPASRLLVDVSVDRSSLGGLPSLRHAFEGGYFSLSRVEYRLQPLAGGDTQLTLSCRYGLHTSVNFYGRAWMGLILRDFEVRLLQAVRSRAERGAPSSHSPAPIAGRISL